MSIKSGQAVTVLFTTHDAATGAAGNATGTPTGTIYVNGTANGASVTVTNVTTGLYKAAVTLPSLSAGDIASMRIAATVSSVAGEGVIWQDSADTKRVSDLQDLSAAQVNTEADTAISDAALATAATATAIKAKTDTIPASPAAVGSAMTLATNSITAAAVATDAVAEIQSGLATAAALQTVDDNVDAILTDTGTTLDTLIKDIPTVSEFEARTIVAANYFDPAADTVANVTTVGSVTNKTGYELTAGYDAAKTAASATALATVAGYVDTEVAAILAAVDTEVAAIKAKTDNLPSDPADESVVLAAITAATSPLATAANLATVDGVVDTILLDTNELQTNQGNWATANISSLATASALATVAGYVDTEVAAIKAKTDNIPASPAAVGSPMTLASNSVTAAAVASDAVTEIQSGLATAAAVTALHNLSAQQVWEYVTRELTSAGSSGATAAEVWAYATRILTADTNIDIPDSTAIQAAAAAALTAYDPPTHAELTSAVSPLATATNLATVDGKVDSVLGDTNELQTNQGNWATATGFSTLDPLDSTATQAAAAAALTAYDAATGTDVNAATSGLPTATEIADAILSRGVGNVEDTADAHSLAAIVLATLESLMSGTTWTIYKTNGVTPFTTKTLTVDASADPVVGAA